MALDYELARMFAKMTNDQGSRVSEATVQGTVKEYAGGMYVQLDGSDLLTPVSSTTGMKDGDRVNVMIKDHSATVTGNTTAPSATKNDTDIIQGQLDDTVDQISEFEIVLAGKVDTEVLNAQIARIDNLTADNVVIKESLSATEANIKDLQAENVTISGQLDAFEADIDNLHANMLTAEAADLKYATIENLEATDAKIYNLEGTYAEFEQTVTEKLTATDASIENLEATKLSAEEADLKYANIDFANIGKAAIENFFSKSGMIGDLVVGEGTITGTLVGVTIKGDLIEGGTVVADKLVIKGEDGLYYKLNTDGETIESSQTDYNSLNGSVITAKSITATKISVDDLVAFDATIGGFKITESSIYSGVKESIDNTTRGIFMDDTGQMALGDQSNYLKYFKDTDGVWKLIISAGSIKLGGSSKDIETAFDEINQKIENVEGSAPIETVSGEGYVSIGENGGKKPYEIVIYGKTRQNLWVNPYGTKNGVTVTNNANGTMTVSGTATSEANIFQSSRYNLKPGSTYTLSVDSLVSGLSGALSSYGFLVQSYNGATWKNLGAVGVSETSKTFTVPTDSVFTSRVFVVPSGKSVSGTYRVMLNEGTEAEPWCPPGLNSIGDLDYVYGIGNTGNVASIASWSLNGITVSAMDSDGWMTISGTSTSSSPFGGGATVIINRPPKGLKISVALEGTSNQHVYMGVNYRVAGQEKSTNAYVGSSAYPIEDSFVVGDCWDSIIIFIGILGTANGKSINLKVRPVFTFGDKPQYVPSSYSSFIRNSKAIPLQGYTLGSCPDGTRDELHIYRDGSRKLIKRTWRQTITGTSAAWTKYTPNTKWTTLSQSVMEKYVHKDCTDIGLASKASFGDILPPSPGCWGNSTRGYAFTPSSYPTYAKFIYINTPENDLELAKTWLTNNPLTVVYKLKDEIEIELDPIDLPEFNAESAIAIFDSGISGLIPDIDVTYWTTSGATIADADSAANNAEDKIDNLDVGATNLALHTDRPKTYIQAGTNNWFTNKDTTDAYIYGPRTSDLGLSLLKKGGEFTVSFDWAAVNVPKAFEFYVALENRNGAYHDFGSTYTMPKQAAVSGHFVTTSVPSAEQMEWGRGFLFGGIGSGTNYPDFEITISNFKFEKGNKETTWSQAPEELASGEYVDDIEESISSDIAGLEETMNEVFINIDSINAKMEFLVTDEDGNSMMTQTSDGWTFNMSSIQNTVDKAIEDIDTIHGDISSANKIINDTKNLVDDISQKTAYINLGQDDSGSPCILLGDTASPFKLRITNTSIDFMEGSDKIAYVTNRQLYIQSSVVTDEMRVGSLDQNTGKFEGFVWKKRANGNMGLRWEG